MGDKEEGVDDWTLESGLKSGISNLYNEEDWDTDDDSEEGDGGNGDTGDNGAGGEGTAGDNEISNKGSDWDTGEDTGLGTTTSGEDDEESDDDDDDDDDDDEEDWSAGDNDDESSEDVSIDDDDTDFKPSFHGDSYHFTTLKPESAPLNSSTSNIIVAKDEGEEGDPMFDDEFLETLDDEKNKKPGSTSSIESEEEVRALIKRLVCFMVCLLVVAICITLPVLIIENNKDDPKTDMPTGAPTMQPTMATSIPTFNPTTTPYPSTSPPTLSPTPLPFIATSIVVRYDIIVPNGKETNSTSISYSTDLVEAMNRLAGNVLTTLNIGSGAGGDDSNNSTATDNPGASLEQQTNSTDASVGGFVEQTNTNATVRRRLRLRQRLRFLQEMVQLQLPTIIINIRPLECPVNAFVGESDRCEEVTALVTLESKNVDDINELNQQYTQALRSAIENGGMETILNEINPTLNLIVYLNIPGTTDSPTVTPSASPTVAPTSFMVNCSDFIYRDTVVIEPSPVATTSMLPNSGDCADLDQTGFPHVFDQCACGEKVLSSIPDDVQAFAESLLNETELFAIIYDTDVDVVSIIYQGNEMDTGININRTEDASDTNINSTGVSGDTNSTDSAIPSCHPFNMALFWLSSGDNHRNGDIRQRFILALIYFELGGNKWLDQNGWLSTTNECQWFGVTCNEHDVITGLAFDGNDIEGPLPTELGKLEGLSSLQIKRSKLTGSIPSSLFSLECLLELDFSDNQLSGSLLTDLDLEVEDIATTNTTGGSRLERLSVSKNSFDGQLGPGIGMLRELKQFDLSINNFTGPIPSEIGMLTLLEEWNTALNKFSGTLPSEIGYLGNLRFLEINNCQLTGSLPSEMGNCTSLSRLKIQSNQLSGTVPSTLGTLSSLQIFSLEGNLLTGDSPTEVCALRSQSLVAFTVDCLNVTDGTGVNCTVPTCCTGCSET